MFVYCVAVVTILEEDESKQTAVETYAGLALIRP